MSKTNQNRKALLLPALILGDHMFYYLCVELLINDLAETSLGAKYVVPLYGAISVATAVGFLLFPLFYHFFKTRRRRRLALYTAWAINLVSLCIIMGTPIPILFTTTSLLVTMSAGYIGGYVFYYLAMSPLPKGSYGMFFGVISAIAMAMSYPANWMIRALGDYGDLFQTVLLALCISGSAALLLFGDTQRIPFQTPEERPVVQKDMRKYLWGTFGIILILCCLIGIADGVVTSLHAGQILNVSGIPRLLNAPAMIAAGFLFDYKKGRYLPMATMIMMMVLTIGVFLFNSADGYNTALGLLYVCGSVGSIYAVAALTVTASSTNNPCLWASMGRVGKYIFNGLMAVCGGLLFGQGFMLTFLIVFVVLMALLFLLFTFQGKLSVDSREPVSQIRTAHDLSVYDFTDREKEILQKILTSEKSIKELAEELFISERVLYRHLDSIYKKTGTTSRMGLVLLYYGNNTSAAQEEQN